MSPWRSIRPVTRRLRESRPTGARGRSLGGLVVGPDGRSGTTWPDEPLSSSTRASRPNFSISARKSRA